MVNTISHALEKRGYEILKEHTFKLPAGNCKPDIVATKRGADDGKSIILDVQVVSAKGLEQWHRA